MLYLRDHHRIGLSLDCDVAGLKGMNATELSPGIGIAESLSDATYAIVHLDNDEMADLEREWELSCSADLILLRVSRDGKEKLAAAGHEERRCKLERGEWRLWILNARDDSALDMECVRGFCSLSGDQARAVCQEELGFLTGALFRLFRPRFMPHLVALDILCQGYRIAHSFSRQSSFALSGRQVESTEAIGWWMKCLGVKSLVELRKRLANENVDAKRVDEIIEAFSEGSEIVGQDIVERLSQAAEGVRQ